MVRVDRATTTIRVTRSFNCAAKDRWRAFMAVLREGRLRRFSPLGAQMQNT